jgi:hypothetical protein
MLPLFAHHTRGFLEIEIMGREFPTGPEEHALAFGLTAVAVVLMLYGVYALVRDVWRWARRGKTAPAP